MLFPGNEIKGSVGLLPITAFQRPCVTSVWPIQKSRLIRTRCWVSSLSRPGSLEGLPIVNSPAGMRTILKETPFTVNVRVSPALPDGRLFLS